MRFNSVYNRQIFGILQNIRLSLFEWKSSMQDASDKLSSFAPRNLFQNYATIYTRIATELCHLPGGILSHHQVETFLMSSAPVMKLNIFFLLLFTHLNYRSVVSIVKNGLFLILLFFCCGETTLTKHANTNWQTVLSKSSPDILKNIKNTSTSSLSFVCKSLEVESSFHSILHWTLS